MRVTFSIPFYLVLVASPTVAAPAEAPDARSGGTVQITLVEAIQQALVRNPDLAVTRRDIDIGQGRLRHAAKQVASLQNVENRRLQPL